MEKVIVATFESRAEAERAAELLADAGVERREIDIRSEAWTGAARTDTEGSGSWWDWLFGESDDRSYYNEELSRGGAVLRVTVADARAERVREFLEARGGDVDETTTHRPDATVQRAETTASQPESRTRAAGRDEEVIPVVEERLKVGKRPVSRGGVRVYTHVDERPVEEQVSLREERVHVDRRPVDRAVSATDEAFRDREIEVTATSEEVVVAKEARVVEEVAIGKEVGERVETVRDSVRRTEVEVENVGGGTAAREQLLDRNDEDFRRHWSTIFESRGIPYEQCRSAYGYGCDLGSDQRYAGRDWSAIESEVQRDWERGNPGTWQQYKEPIRYSWDRVRQGVRRAA